MKNTTTELRALSASDLFAIGRVWRAVIYGMKELRKFWNKPVCVWINENTGERQVAPASDGLIFWRIFVIGRGKPTEGLYSFRLWRFGIRKKAHADVHPASSLLMFIRENIIDPSGSSRIPSTSASDRRYCSTACQPGSVSCGSMNAGKPSDDLTVPNEDLPLDRICTHEPDADLSSSRVIVSDVGLANVPDQATASGERR